MRQKITMDTSAPATSWRKLQGGRQRLALSVLLASGLAAAGCGKTSFFDVTVTIKQVAGVSTTSLQEIDLCRVTVSGAATDGFALSTCGVTKVQSFQLGIFQYGTDTDSGMLRFQVDMYSQDHATVLGTGTGTGAIISGGRQTVAVEVVPDPTKFLTAP